MPACSDPAPVGRVPLHQHGRYKHAAAPPGHSRPPGPALPALTSSRLAHGQELWKTRQAPRPLVLEQLLPDMSGLEGPAEGGSACKALGLKDPQATWSNADSARVLLKAIVTFLESRWGAGLCSAVLRM
jgi:hypothetical protein